MTVPKSTNPFDQTDKLYNHVTIECNANLKTDCAYLRFCGRLDIGPFCAIFLWVFCREKT